MSRSRRPGIPLRPPPWRSGRPVTSFSCGSATTTGTGPSANDSAVRDPGAVLTPPGTVRYQHRAGIAHGGVVRTWTGSSRGSGATDKFEVTGRPERQGGGRRGIPGRRDRDIVQEHRASVGPDTRRVVAGHRDRHVGSGDRAEFARNPFWLAAVPLTVPPLKRYRARCVCKRPGRSGPCKAHRKTIPGDPRERSGRSQPKAVQGRNCDHAVGQ